MREFGPWDHQTFDIIVGEMGGSDRDQGNNAEAMELFEDGSTVGEETPPNDASVEAVHPLFSEAIPTLFYHRRETCFCLFPPNHSIIIPSSLYFLSTC